MIAEKDTTAGELAHSSCLRDVYDLTAAEGTTALTFARLQVPYVGL